MHLAIPRNGSVDGKPAILAHVYGTAGCPAPKGSPGASFPFAKASFAFAGEQPVTSTLTRSCGRGDKS